MLNLSYGTIWYIVRGLFRHELGLPWCSEQSLVMEYLIRLAQVHETFRWPELQSLAIVEGISLDLVEYSTEVRKYPQICHILQGQTVRKLSIASKLFFFSC